MIGKDYRMCDENANYVQQNIICIMPSSGLCRVACQSLIEIPTFFGCHHKSMFNYQLTA